MKRLLSILALVASVVAHAALTNEVLVLTTATTIPRNSKTRGLEILNLGPNDIWCSADGTPVANRSRKIASGSSWSLDVASDVVVKCLASTANQITGSATIVTEAP